MTEAKKLDAAVATFQQAEAALKELFDEIESLVKVSTKFEEARQGLVEASTEIGSLAATQGNLSKTLADLSKKLVDTTEVVRKVNPERLYSELEKVRQDYQAQIERIGTLGGDLRSRIDSSGKKVSSRVAEIGTELEESMESTRRRVTRWSLLLALLGLSMIGLQITQLMRG